MRGAAVPLTLLALAAALTGPPAAASPPGHGSHQTRLVVRHSDCYELVLPRAAERDAVRAVVPQRYSLAEFETPLGPAARMWIINNSCSVAVDGHRRAATTLGLAQLSARDGIPGFAYYLLWVGTDDQVAAAHYQQLGWPARYIPGSSSSDVPVDAGSSAVDFSFVGGGLDHHLSATVTEPPPMVQRPGSIDIYYAAPHGEIRARDFNTLRPQTNAVITGVLSGVEPLPQLLAPRLETPTGAVVPTGFTRGGWTRTVELLP